MYVWNGMEWKTLPPEGSFASHSATYFRKHVRSPLPENTDFTWGCVSPVPLIARPPRG